MKKLLTIIRWPRDLSMGIVETHLDPLRDYVVLAGWTVCVIWLILNFFITFISWKSIISKFVQNKFVNSFYDFGKKNVRATYLFTLDKGYYSRLRTLTRPDFPDFNTLFSLLFPFYLAHQQPRDPLRIFAMTFSSLVFIYPRFIASLPDGLIDGLTD